MSLVALGKAYELEYRRDGSSRSEVVKFPGWWWAWSGSDDGGHILLVKPMSILSSAPKGTARRMASKFHGVTPDKNFDVLAPDISETKRAGLVVSFAYDARSFSSSKRTMPYRHHFGAETHDDKPPFPDSALPYLAVSPDGGLVIKRRAGNTFRLADWVIG